MLSIFKAFVSHINLKKAFCKFDVSAVEIVMTLNQSNERFDDKF